MRLKEAGRMLFGGCTVYVIMAACSGSEGSSGSGTTSSSGSAMGGSAGSEGNGGIGGMAEGGRDGGIFDALTDPVPEADAEPMSGSRLKGKFLLGSDGSKQYQQTALGSGIGTNQLYVHAIWFDSLRQEDCIFTTAADGQTRCVPVGIEGILLYSDAQCTQGAVGILGVPPQACGWVKPKYLTTTESQTPCPGPPLHRAYPIGAYVGGAAYVKDGLNNCSPYQSSPIGELYAVGAEVDPTEFVAATEGVDP